MKKMLGVMIGLALSATVAASPGMQVEVEWKSPENYRDIDHGTTQSKKKFRKRLFDIIERRFEENMEPFSDKYNLKVTMLDVDLAGQISRGLTQEIRMVHDHDFPRLHFYIIVENKNGEIVLQGEQNIKERKDKHKSFRMRGSQSEFYLEKDLIDTWFEKALVPALNQS